MRKRLRPHSKYRLPLLRWHRRIGVTVSLLVIWLAISGVLLNHSDYFKFDDQPVNNSLLLTVYGVERPKPVSYFQADRWFSHLGGNQLYLDGVEVAYCPAPLMGVVWAQQQFVIACGDGLLLMTAEGEVIEQLGSVYGLPEAIEGLAFSEGLLLMNTSLGVQLADLERLQWRPYPHKGVISWSVPIETPAHLLERLQPFIGSELSWERVLLDLHSGNVGGQAGRWIMDLAAILLLLLAVSGVWVWARRPG